jgi:hypothetical protein
VVGFSVALIWQLALKVSWNMLIWHKSDLAIWILNKIRILDPMLEKVILIKAILLLLSMAVMAEGYCQASPTNTSGISRHSLGFFAGSSALIGIDYAQPIRNRAWLRASLSFMDFNIRKWETNFNRAEQYASIDLDVRNTSLSLFLDYLLQPKLQLRLVTGFGFFPMNAFSGSIKLRDPLKLNDIYFHPDELGYVLGGIRYNLKFNPYFGIALGRLSHPSRRLTFSCDIGTYYKGAPEVFINGTALIRNNEHNAEVLTNNMTGYRWYPVFNLRLGYSIDPKDNP